MFKRATTRRWTSRLERCFRQSERALVYDPAVSAAHGVPVASESRFIEVKVKPHSVASSLRQEASGAWVAELRSPPIDGKANAELIALVARHFGCRTTAVSIKRGGTGRKKLLKIESD